MACNVGCEFQLLFESAETNFTCQQLTDYCIAYQKWKTIEYYIGQVINVSLLVAGFGGLISYILMVIVFRLPDFKGASYIYHKSIAYMEILHMFVMAQSGLERFLPSDKTTYSYVFYIKIIRELWLLGDAMKLSTSMVTTFLSMERFVALWSPRGFACFNRPKIAWTFVVISFFFSLLSFSPAFTEKMEQQQINNITTWVAVPKNSNLVSNVGGNEIVTDLIYVAKCVTSVAMIVCCIGVALGLVLKSRKASTMTSAARCKWKENRRLSILQIMIATLQIIDHVMWVINNIIYDRQPPSMFLGLEAITLLTFEKAMNVVEYKALWRWTMACQEVTGILDHATRLPLYLIGMKKFREGFVNTFTKKGVGHYMLKSPGPGAVRQNAVAPGDG